MTTQSSVPIKNKVCVNVLNFTAGELNYLRLLDGTNVVTNFTISKNGVNAFDIPSGYNSLKFTFCLYNGASVEFDKVWLED